MQAERRVERDRERQRSAEEGGCVCVWGGGVSGEGDEAMAAIVKMEAG